MASTPFAENFDRLLGFHQLTADWAAPLLGVSVATVSYWRNGHREPDVASLRRLGEVFELDPFALLTTPFVDLLPVVADAERFQSVERRIVHEQYTGEVLPVSSSRRARREAKREAATAAPEAETERRRRRGRSTTDKSAALIALQGSGAKETPSGPSVEVANEEGRRTGRPEGFSEATWSAYEMREKRAREMREKQVSDSGEEV
jgi:transcriptional regulator with XRE-family HTH domain